MPSLFGFEVSNTMALFIMVFGGALLVVAGRYIAAYLNAPGSAEDRFEWATNRTAGWLSMIVGGVVAAAGIGIVQGVDIVAQISMFIAGHPFAFSNLAAIGLGAGALSGLLELTVDQYVGVAMAIVGGTFLLQEVYGDAS